MRWIAARPFEPRRLRYVVFRHLGSIDWNVHFLKFQLPKLAFFIPHWIPHRAGLLAETYSNSHNKIF